MTQAVEFQSEHGHVMEVIGGGDSTTLSQCMRCRVSLFIDGDIKWLWQEGDRWAPKEPQCRTLLKPCVVCGGEASLRLVDAGIDDRRAEARCLKETPCVVVIGPISICHKLWDAAQRV